MIGPVSHDPQQLKEALLGTSSIVVLDTETTGLDVLGDRVLSYGLRLFTRQRWMNFILFTDRCAHVAIRPFVTDDAGIQDALVGLGREDLVLVGHNLKYDLAMLLREGITVRAFSRDTLSLARMLDQDRGFSRETNGRRMLRSPDDRRWTNYRLKDLGAHLLGVKPLYTPHQKMITVGYRHHAGYLAHDLFVTHKLYDYLWDQTPTKLQAYHDEVQAPLADLLLGMQVRGIAADPQYLATHTSIASNLSAYLSQEHNRTCGLPLANITDANVRQLLYGTYHLPAKRGKASMSLQDDVLARHEKASSGKIARSIRLIREYRKLASLTSRIAGVAGHIRTDGRVHSHFDNKQASGRTSSTSPNLQAMAKPVTLLVGHSHETEVRSRDLLVASPGYILVAADVAQADVRVLAHEIDRCQETTAEHRMRLLQERTTRLPAVSGLVTQLTEHQNRFRNTQSAPTLPQFDPTRASPLVDNFVNNKGDFYCGVASAVAGRTILRSDSERSIWKTILLAQINGESPTGLSSRLDCSKSDARDLVAKFFQVYPDIESWLALQRQQVALAGQTYTWEGRYRRSTPHYWMVNEPRVRLLLTYKSGPRRWRYWFEVTPIQPRQLVLTCFIHRVWNLADGDGEKPATLIYKDGKRLGTRAYRHLDEPGFFVLPFRNLPWSKIRRVQKLDSAFNPVEQVRYEGLDKTCRQLVNSVMQGGTADLVTRLMLNARVRASQCGAHLLLSIHDEVVYEAPVELADRFIRGMAEICSQPPGSQWRVPVEMEFKVGRSFGSLAPASF